MCAWVRAWVRGLVLAVIAAAALFTAGCGGGRAQGAISARDHSAKLPRDYQPIRAGRTTAYRLPALSAVTATGRTVAGLRCSRRHRSAYGVHLELYARRLVVPVPAGIGVAAPQHRDGVYVRGGACTYPLRTFEPTGVVVVDGTAATRPTLNALFRVWGQPLSGTRLAGFHGQVAAYVGGRRWRSEAGAISLRRHAEIVLEIGGYVVPHPVYRFAPGL